MSDFAMQRSNMVESQLRPCDITDRRILRAMGEVNREAFLPSQLRAMAYIDDDLRLTGAAVTPTPRLLLAPRTLAQLIQLARVEPGERVLEIGAGTGYATAVLARLAGDVIGVESDVALARQAAAALLGAGAGNARIVTADLAKGHPEDAPYDAIIINGAVARPPSALLDQLKDGGRMVAVWVGAGGDHAVIWRRHGMHFDRRAAFDARTAVLPGFELEPGFSL